MKKCLLAVVMIALFSLPLLAGDFPKVEVFGGYSLFTDNLKDMKTQHGFNGSIAANFNKVLGVVGDLGFVKRGEVKEVTFAGGPQISLRGENARVFVHAMFGGLRLDYGSSNNTAFAVLLGGGLDFKIVKMIHLRPVQFDIIGAKYGGEWGKQFRYSGGIVLEFGGGE
jgi:hypothetical protein